MKQLILAICICLMGFGIQAQQQFHVTTSGMASGNGTLQNPWDLQTALSQKPEVVNGDDTIWLHEGIYTGRYVSSIHSTRSNKYITVAPYKAGQVILNGNVDSVKPSVLEIRGKNVTFKNLEITFLGNFSRDMADVDFHNIDGINHLSGEDCKFINLKIHDNPGSGFGSWKLTGGTLIEGCQIYNNGYFSEVRGSGAGIYVQNSSDKIRMIANNLIFNNYYMGIEVWSANTHADGAYVKNISVENNIIFNNGLPGKHHKNNILVATDDVNGINRATNIVVKKNVLYHNTDIAQNKSSGDAGSLQLGVNYRAPLKNVTVEKNIIIGGNNALRINTAENLTFQNNIVYGGYVHLYKEIINKMNTWQYNNNLYYSKNSRNFRVMNFKDYTFKEWQQVFNLDKNSHWKNNKEFSLQPVLNIIQNKFKLSEFHVALFDKQGNDVEVDFSDFGVSRGSKYVIKDIATQEIINEGIISDTDEVTFIMGKENSTNINFGVYKIVFTPEEYTSTDGLSTIQKIIKWLGI